MAQWSDRAASYLTRRPFLLFVVLHAGVAAIFALAWRLLPGPLHRAILALTSGAGLGAFDAATFGRGGAITATSVAELWAIATVAMAGAGLLALPVAWLYTITRRKRGYNQSVVHTLILLPVVVAGVVVLVKHSLALAFSLAGIVAAVRFRNTLEDSKDAVFIFVATGIGLAAGVELSVAAALAVVFNLTTLLLFSSDFGRTPARLEGEMADERMRRALSVANRTSQFVARLDEEVLEDLAPEQLQAVAERAWQRRQEGGAGGEAGERSRPETLIAARTSDPARARLVVEMVLARHAKRWRFNRVTPGAAEGEQVLEWAVKLRKSVPVTALVDDLRREGAGVLEPELK